MILADGEKVHVITRRQFEGDLRRHFAGQVVAATETTARAQGYTFVFNPTRNEYVKRPERRVRVVSLTDAGVVINVLPASVNVDELVYKTIDGRLFVTDGKAFKLDINEFGAAR